MNKQNKEERLQRARIRINRKVKNIDIINLNKKLNQKEPIYKNQIRKQKIEKGKKIFSKKKSTKEYTNQERQKQIEKGREIYKREKNKIEKQ